MTNKLAAREGKKSEGVPAGIIQGSQMNEEIRMTTQCRVRLENVMPNGSLLGYLTHNTIWEKVSRQ